MKETLVYWWFSPRGRRDHKILLNSRYHYFDSRNGYSSVIIVTLLIFFFSSPKLYGLSSPKLYAMSSNMAAPYKAFYNWKYWNCWIIATSSKSWLENQKLAIWLNWLSCVHFWSQKSGICYLRGFVVTWRHMKTKNNRVFVQLVFLEIFSVQTRERSAVSPCERSNAKKAA